MSIITIERKKYVDEYCNALRKKIALIQFYGVGGIGKTTIARGLYNSEENKKKTYVDISPNIPIIDILVYIRNDFYSQGIKFKEFDFLYEFYCCVYRYNSKISQRKSLDYSLDTLDDLCSIVSDTVEIIPMVGNMAKFVKFGRAAYLALENQKLKKMLKDFANLDKNEFEKCILDSFINGVMESCESEKLFFFDNFEKIPNKTLKGIEELINNIPSSFWVICGREKINFDNISSKKECLISKLDENEVKEMLQASNISIDNIEYIYERSEGIPYIVAVYIIFIKEKKIDFSEKLDAEVNREWVERILDHLTDADKLFLIMLSTMEYFDYNLAFYLYQKEFCSKFTFKKKFEALLSFDFIACKTEGNYYINDIFSKRLFKYQDEIIDLNEINDSISEYYMTKIMSEIMCYRFHFDKYFNDYVNHVNKLIKSKSLSENSTNNEVKKILTAINDIIEVGRHALAKDALVNIFKSEKVYQLLNDELKLEIDLLLVKIYIDLGEFDLANDVLKKCQHQINKNEYLEKKWMNSFSLLYAQVVFRNSGEEEALNILGNIKIPDIYDLRDCISYASAMAIKAHYQIFANEYDKAIETAREGLSFIQECNDYEKLFIIKSFLLRKIGKTYHKKKEYDNARLFYESSINELVNNKVVSSVDYSKNLGMAYKRLGEALGKLEQFNDSQDNFERAISIYKKVIEQKIDDIEIHEKIGFAYLDRTHFFKNETIQFQIESIDAALNYLGKAASSNSKNYIAMNGIIDCKIQKSRLYTKKEDCQELIIEELKSAIEDLTNCLGKFDDKFYHFALRKDCYNKIAEISKGRKNISEYESCSVKASWDGSNIYIGAVLESIFLLKYCCPSIKKYEGQMSCFKKMPPSFDEFFEKYFFERNLNKNNYYKRLIKCTKKVIEYSKTHQNQLNINLHDCPVENNHEYDYFRSESCNNWNEIRSTIFLQNNILKKASSIKLWELLLYVSEPIFDNHRKENNAFLNEVYNYVLMLLELEENIDSQLLRKIKGRINSQ